MTKSHSSASAASGTGASTGGGARVGELAVSGDLLRIRVHWPVRDVVVVQADGALDAAGEPRFAEPLRNRLVGGRNRVVLDLSGVTFLDTAAAVTMLEAATQARARGNDLRVVSSAPVDRLLRLIEIADRFTFTPSVDRAVAELCAAAGEDRTSSPVSEQVETTS